MVAWLAELKKQRCASKQHFKEKKDIASSELNAKNILRKGLIRISSQKTSIIIGITYDISINRKNDGVFNWH